MQTQPLLYGLIGFFIGGLLVSVAAATMNMNKPEQTATSMSMDAMTADLRSKTGAEFDKAFIANMIAHHQGAVEMAELAAQNAQHQEIKTLSLNIISAQQQEIADMQRWQADWGYTPREKHDAASHH